MSKAYRVVRLINNDFVTVQFTGRYAFKKWCGMMGFKVTGQHSNPQTREALQGEPVLAEFCGPMYDGTNDAGLPVVRYEDWAANDRLSV